MPQATIDPLLRHKQNQVRRALSGRKVYETAYHADTPDAVCEALEYAMKNRPGSAGGWGGFPGVRIHLFYGDTATGRSWLEEHDVEGYVGRSMGPVKIPLLIRDRRWRGGSPILDDCIVKIYATGKPRDLLYLHPMFHLPVLEVRHVPEPPAWCRDSWPCWRVCADGDDTAGFKTEAKARQWIAKME